MAVTSEQMREYEDKSERMGVPRVHLMEHAGRRAAEFIETLVKPGSRIAVFCGRGNKGGDGFVCARYLSEKHPVMVYLVAGGPKTKEAEEAYVNLRETKVILQWVSSADQVTERGFDVIVDALLGTGMVREPLKEPIHSLVALINQMPGTKVSLDVPTGVHPDTGEVLGIAVVPHHTLSFHARKVGLNQTRAPLGDVHVIDIGIPPEACA